MKGRDKLRKKLAAAPKAVRAQLRKDIEASATELVRLQRAMVPVDSGALRNSIQWDWQNDDEISASVFAAGGEAFYGIFQEHGTKTQPANPFFYVAYRSLKKRIQARINRGITKSLKAVAAGGQ